MAEPEYLIICIRIRSVTRAIAATEVVIVVISDVFLVFILRIQTMIMSQNRKGRQAGRLKLRLDSQELVGT